MDIERDAEFREINQAEEEKGTVTNVKETVLALGIYIAAYCYMALAGKAWLIVFPALFVLAVEYMYRGVPRQSESWVWLASMVLIVLCELFGRGRAWDGFASHLFIHVFAVWWMLSRSGKLVEGQSGRMLPIDALDGFVIFPFGNFFLRIKTVLQSFGRLLHARGSSKRVLSTLAALLLSALLLYISANSLSEADSIFGSVLNDILDGLRIDISDETLFDVFLSLPVGAYLFGLIAGSSRISDGKLRARRENADAVLGKLHTVPDTVWIVSIGIFCLLYAAFIFWQASYLFGAFTRTLPEGFIVSEYARQGFFELCRVMALNFVLLWLVLRTGEKKSERMTKVMCTLLLSASLLFAAVAISKLALYISCFGFTEKRLQSSWLVTVLAAGCIAALYTLWTGKKSFRGWMVFGALSLALMHIY